MQYHAPGGAWINVTTQASSFTLTNLTCATAYEWHVAAICNNTTVPSAYSAAAGFTTLPCPSNCITPTGPHTTNINQTGATFSWTAGTGVLSYIVQYRPLTPAGSAWITVNAQTTSITLTSLVCGTVYEWHVAAICGTSAGNTSAYTTPVSFTTTACTTACTAPTGLTASGTAAGTTLSWTGPAGAFAYIVQYHAPGGAWITVTSQASHITLTNLACGTAYEWHVAAYCNNNSSTPSAYSTTAVFTTLACTPICLTPTGPHTTNITQTGATFSWTAVTGALSYIVQYRLLISAGAAWTTVNTQTTSITLNNLVCGLTYEWRVATVCGTAAGNTSAYTTPLNFTTTACTAPCPAPTGLTVTSTASGTTLQWTGPAGAFAYIVQYHSANGAWINVTSQANHITLTNLPCGTVFEWHVAAYCGNNTSAAGPYSATAVFTTLPCTTNCITPAGPHTTNITQTGATFSWTAVTGALAYIVQYRPLTPAGTAWITVNPQTTSITLTNLVCGTAYEWHVATVCGTAAGNISAYTTPLSFTTNACTTTCTAPTGLTAGNINPTGATLAWNAVTGATGYIVQYHSANGAWITVTTQTNHVTLTGLTCGTVYEWHVATICANGTNLPGPYSAVAVFTTLPCTTNCSTPSGLTTGNITATGATVSWNPVAGVGAYIVQYHSANGTWVNVTTQTSHVTLTNLTCGTTYEWHVASLCGSANSPFSTVVSFTTSVCSPTCVPPAGLTTTNITTTGATLNWIAPAGASAYIVQYHSANGTWITVTTQTNHVTLTGLTCGTVYEWHVAALCNNGTTVPGQYSATISFTTAPCTTTCAAPGGLTTTNISPSGATLSWNASAGALGYIVQYHIPGGAWISVTAQTNHLTLVNLTCGTVYEWHVAAYCGSSATSISPYSAGLVFTTLPCTSNVCPVPVGLTSLATSAAGGSRMLTWSPVNATLYNIRYRIINTATWITTTSNTNSKLITGLQATSHYEWQVQSVCTPATGATSLSAWSAPAFFDTPISRMIYPNPASGRIIQVPVETENEARINVIISDHLGKIITTVDKVITTGGSIIDIDIANLSTGIYFVRIVGANTSEVQKLFITR